MDEKRKGKKQTLEKPVRCYRCQDIGHYAFRCTRKSSHDLLVKGTEGGTWNEIWFVNASYKWHVTGNKELFVKFKDNFANMFLHGVGDVNIFLNGKMRDISCVSFVPNLDKNVLSVEQLMHQGYEVLRDGDKCFVKGMFESLHELDHEEWHAGNYVNEKSQGSCNQVKEKTFFEIEKNCLKDYLDLMKEGEHRDVEEKKESLMNYVKQCKEEASKFEGNSIFPNNTSSIESCITLLDMLRVHELFMKYKEAFKVSFNTLVEWFIKDFLKIKHRSIFPPRLDNGEEVDLFDLYICVQSEGGYKNVSKECKWKSISNKMGFGMQEELNLKLIYVKYLDLFEWYYNMMKERMQNTQDQDELKVQAKKVNAIRDFPPGCGPIIQKGMEDKFKKEDQGEDDNIEEFEDEEDFVLIMNKDATME